jgi:hypothetical protein
VLALVQVYFGTVSISPLREPGAPWSLGFAVWSAAFGLMGVAILALAARNCRRLWRVPPREVSWALVAVTLLVALLSALWATGPLSIGLWRWWSLIPGAFAAFLLVVVVRDVRTGWRTFRADRHLLAAR